MSAKKSNHTLRTIIGAPRIIDREKGIAEVPCRLENPKGSEDYIVEVRGNATSPGKIEIPLLEISNQIRAQLATLWSEKAFVGEKVTEGGTIGSEKRWGTEAEKRQRWANYQNYMNKLYEAHPYLSYTFLARKIASDFTQTVSPELRHPVSPRTVMRHTRDPRKIQ